MKVGSVQAGVVKMLHTYGLNVSVPLSAFSKVTVLNIEIIKFGGVSNMSCIFRTWKHSCMWNIRYNPS